jgi:hypothetical protein
MKNSVTMQTMVNRHPRTLSSELQGDVVLLQLDQARYFGLEGVGSRVWQLLAIPRSVQQIVEFICGEYQVSPEKCQVDLLRLLAELYQAELIEVQDEPDQKNEGTDSQ